MRRRRRRIPTDGVWRNSGGGCLLVPGIRYACDADYVRRLPGGFEERLEINCTREAYVALPARAKRASEILNLPGVRLYSRSKRRVYHSRRLRPYGKRKKGKA